MTVVETQYLRLNLCVGNFVSVTRRPEDAKYCISATLL